MMELIAWKHILQNTKMLYLLYWRGLGFGYKHTLLAEKFHLYNYINPTCSKVTQVFMTFHFLAFDMSYTEQSVSLHIIHL